MLYGMIARSALLSAAAAPFRVFVPIWSTSILCELQRNLSENGAMSADKAEALLARMRSAHPSAVVDPDQGTVRRMPNHPKDRHVLAVALMASARIVVTRNVRDFHGAEWVGVRALMPDQFLTELCELQPDEMRASAAAHAAQLTQPPLTFDEVVHRYEQAGLVQFAARLRSTSGDEGD